MARPTFYVKTTTKGKNPISWIREVEGRIYFEFQYRLMELGELTAERMKGIVTSSGYKLDKLANAIDSKILQSVAGVVIGIGEIAKMPKSDQGNTYWEAFNDGFTPGSSNKLVPLGSFDGNAPSIGHTGSKWQVGTGNYTFLDNIPVKRTVEPLRYIQISEKELEKHIIKEISRLTKELNQASK